MECLQGIRGVSGCCLWGLEGVWVLSEGSCMLSGCSSIKKVGKVNLVLSCLAAASAFEYCPSGGCLGGVCGVSVVSGGCLGVV